MVKFRVYKSYFGNISYVIVDNFFCHSNALEQLMDVFKPQHLIVSITALDQDSSFYELVSNEKTRFKVVLPKNNTITSETVVVSTTSDFLSVFDLLVKSEPRCITLYGVKDNIEIDRLNYKEFQYADDAIVKKDVIGYAISIIAEECCVKIAFNTNLYASVDLFKIVKKKLQGL